MDLRTAIECAELCRKSYDDNLPEGFREYGDLRFGLVNGILVFRGTANLPNALRDAFVLPARTRGGYMAHRGFVDALESLYSRVCHTVGVGARKDIIVTGHSLGGAMALLCAEVFECRVVTFGCPRAYLRFSSTPKVEHYRVICDDDPVPMIPRIFYRHCCDPHVLGDDDGGIDVKDHGIDVYLSRLISGGAPVVQFA